MARVFHINSPEMLQKIVAGQCQAGAKLLAEHLDDLLMDGNDMLVSFKFILSGGVSVIFTATLECERPTDEVEL